MLSFPTLGTWIEIRVPGYACACPWSFPTLGTWIEINTCGAYVSIPFRRSLHWERGLKFPVLHESRYTHRRSLHWERGLKYRLSAYITQPPASFPTLGTWIEIFVLGMAVPVSTLSFPTLGTWIEIFPVINFASPNAVVPYIGNVD